MRQNDLKRTKESGEHLFFSIIIPAHNEEGYIGKTLDYVLKSDYPKEKYEVIVVENGSTDKTISTLDEYKNKGIRVFSTKGRGVSKAKNYGISKISPASYWTIFLDADTLLMKNFLKTLNSYLIEKENKNLVVGTTAVRPTKNSRYAKAWFSFYNFAHWLIRVSFSIQIAKSSILDRVKFDEYLSYSEDYKFVRDSQKFGKFFFLRTNDIITSTRRFDKEGWFRLFFKWIIRGVLPENIRKRISYEVIR
jgi:glycosyltransferase involved in cell wall biosynthesis